MSSLLVFPAKSIRAQVIADYTRSADLRGCVVFGCGNGAAAIREQGVFVVDVSEQGDIEARRWWTPAEIARTFPGLFDATSGHLPVWMMLKIGQKFREYLGDIPGGHVPTGSGETILCLRWAYPEKEFTPAYGINRATKFEPLAPLNCLVCPPLQGAEDISA